MRRRLLILSIALSASFPGLAQPRDFARHVVAAAHPLATAAGLEILREGGSAADAAVAIQMVLGLVEPQSSGLGGGAFAVSLVKATGEVLAWDGRETAPAAAGPDLFLGRDGKPMSLSEAGLGGRAVGVPGALRMLEALHKAQGRLPWGRLFQPAIQLAESGFVVTPRLAAAIAGQADGLRRQPAARAIFFLADGTPLQAGMLLVNHPLADTLRLIAASGADALLRGPIASDIATTVRSDPNPGLMTTDDLAAITPRVRPALCDTYRLYRVCSVGPPSAGGVGVLEILGMLSHFNLVALEPEGIESAHLLLEAEKLALADRDAFLADPEFEPVPVRGLLDGTYLATRAHLIAPSRAMRDVLPGTPDQGDAKITPSVTPAGTPVGTPIVAPSLAQQEHGTSAFGVIDDDGNAISLTTTIQGPFGSRLMVRGFMLNDELTDFSFLPERDGKPVANRVAGGKRPRSSMAPVLVFAADGPLLLGAGSEGGGRIIGFVAHMLVRMLDFGMTPQQAVTAGHVGIVAGVSELEAETTAAGLAEGLRTRGQVVQVRKVDSGQQVVEVTPQGLVGAADPRREGSVGGD